LSSLPRSPISLKDKIVLEAAKNRRERLCLRSNLGDVEAGRKARLYLSGARAAALDHDDLGLNQFKIMNVIDSNSLEWDAGGKARTLFLIPL
jgi:hypothetical protein